MRPIDKKSRAIKDREFLTLYDKSRRTLYVANLPMASTEEELEEFFSRAGEVSHVNIVRPGKATDYAFVEFVRPDVVDSALIHFVSSSSTKPQPIRVTDSPEIEIHPHARPILAHRAQDLQV